ncbi:N-acetylmuramoyl-L-alanine amidase [Aureimonas psammosilenae]|uniref:N-acetylmuramoyl-L-alanine amidase n=1 Tax=Aureimonas psammosilenae TaxID=2495496 RepID=UPI00186A0BF4|nr:N-acetylmuramoyl-L-alanine amidase [Aureimonas psammosilenae]
MPEKALFLLCRRVLLVAMIVLGCVSGGRAVAEEPRDAVLTRLEQRAVDGGVEIELRLTAYPRTKLMVLRGPDRVVLDLYDTVTAVKSVNLDANPVISNLRQGLIAKDRFRMILELKRPAVPELVAESGEGEGHVLRLRLKEADARSFEAAVASAAANRNEAAPVEAKAAGAEEPKYTVVIDPGHGGVDTGAIGKHGTLEKDVNLKFGLALRDELAKQPRIRVLMTRSDDTFVSLGERSEFARRERANLFVSMHSDSIRYADIRGATVYTLSEKASDSLSGEVAESENSADRFVDPKWREDKPEVFDILIELTRRETDNLSEHFAAGLVKELGRHDIRLIRNPKRSAGFKVLTAPDVPSVLLEIGYLSNVDDEQLLLDESWRRDSASAIASAIERFVGTKEQGQAASGG